MIHQLGGGQLKKHSGLQERRTSQFFLYKTDVVQYASDLLTRLNHGETLQSIIITPLEKSEGYYVTDVIMYSSVEY